jgi:hypothetical protein
MHNAQLARSQTERRRPRVGFHQFGSLGCVRFEPLRGGCDLAFVPLLVHVIAGGRVDLGGGEKDLVWVLPWTLWSVLFGLNSLVLWRRHWPARRSTVWSAAVGLMGVLVTAAILAVFGQLGVAGLF